MSNHEKPREYFVQLGASGITEQRTYPSDISVIEYSAYQKLESELASLRADLEAVKDNNERLQGLVNAAYEGLRIAVRGRDEQLESANDRLEIVRNNYNEIARERDELQTKLESLNAQNEINKAAATNGQREILELESELASLKSAHEELLSYLPKVPSQPREKEMAQTIASLKAEVERLIHRAVKAETAFDGLQEVVNRYRTALECAQETLEMEGITCLQVEQALASEPASGVEKSKDDEVIERALDKELIKEIAERGVTVDGVGFGKVIAMKQAERIFAMMRALSAALEAVRGSDEA